MARSRRWLPVYLICRSVPPTLCDVPVSAARLPRFHFDGAALARSVRLDAWQELLPGYVIAPSPGATRDAFNATGTAWALGPVRLTAGTMGACRSERTPLKIRRDGEDGFAVHLLAGGSWRGAFGERVTLAGGGQPILVDHARPTCAIAEDCRYISLDVSRDFMEAALPGARGADHGRVLRGAAGALLADYLRLLCRALPEMQAHEAGFLASAARGMLAACLAPSGDALEAARPAIDSVLLARARRRIDASVYGDRLAPAVLARDLGVSRAKLYSVFEPLGGVSAFVLQRRLAEAWRRLSDPTDATTIGTIGAALGFSSPGQFTRSFRAAFGLTPTDLRVGARQPDAATPDPTDGLGRAFRNWLNLTG